jgi:hypothetical protein
MAPNIIETRGISTRTIFIMLTMDLVISALKYRIVLVTTRKKTKYRMVQ